MASLWYRVNQPRVQSSVYTGQWPFMGRCQPNPPPPKKDTTQHGHRESGYF